MCVFCRNSIDATRDIFKERKKVLHRYLVVDEINLLRLPIGLDSIAREWTLPLKKISIQELWSIRQFRSTIKRQKIYCISFLYLFLWPLLPYFFEIVYYPRNGRKPLENSPFYCQICTLHSITTTTYSNSLWKSLPYLQRNMFEMLFHFKRHCTKVTQKSSQVWDLNLCYIVAPRWFSNYQHVQLLLCQNHHKFRNKSNLVHHVMTFQEKVLGGIGIRYPLCISLSRINIRLSSI